MEKAIAVWVKNREDAARVQEEAVYLPHALRLLENRQDYDVKERSELCLLLRRYLPVDGRVREAAIWVRKVVSMERGAGREQLRPTAVAISARGSIPSRRTGEEGGRAAGARSLRGRRASLR
jgi:hypothetical protein